MDTVTEWQIAPAEPAPEPEAVRALAERARTADGVSALSEHSLLHLGSSESVHVAARGGSDLLGYAQIWTDGSAELLVDPAVRCRGVGSALLEESLAQGAKRVWAHGDLPAAAGLAAAYTLARVRELHRMTRPLGVLDAAQPQVPVGFTVRRFVPGQDEDAWVATNAAAFVDHPEQGALTRADLEQRMAQGWFNPDDFIVLTHEDDPAAIAAFHWLKVEPGSAGSGWAHGRSGDEGASATGETYVVGIDPAYQGRGLAGPLTQLGIAHLAGRGLSEVELYVDGDNERAVRTYRKAGFVIAATDVVYAPPA